jgi:serine phosphatase RsbU (regulator of sigma subunit)
MLNLGVTHDYRAPVRPELSGGDVVAVSRREDGSTAVLVADLSVKGKEGTAYASWLASSFQVTSAFVYRPSDILVRLNHILVRAFYDQAAGLFASAFVCRVIPSSSLLIYASAGAEPPLLIRDSVLQATLHTGDLVLGVDRSAAYHDRAFSFKRRDVLIAFTDGIPESHRHATSVQLGADGVMEAIETSFNQSTMPKSWDIFSAIDQLNGGVYQDDATLLVAALAA